MSANKLGDDHMRYELAICSSHYLRSIIEIRDVRLNSLT